jgi:hypothetical protein
MESLSISEGNSRFGFGGQIVISLVGIAFEGDPLSG